MRDIEQHRLKEANHNTSARADDTLLVTRLPYKGAFLAEYVRSAQTAALTPVTNLAFTRNPSTSSHLCTNQSSFHSSRPPALPTMLQYDCTTIGLGNIRPPPDLPCTVYGIHHTILAITLSCKGQLLIPRVNPSTLPPTLTSARPLTRAWVVVRTVVAPPLSVVECGVGGGGGGGVVRVVVHLWCYSCRVVVCVTCFSCYRVRAKRTTCFFNARYNPPPCI